MGRMVFGGQKSKPHHPLHDFPLKREGTVPGRMVFGGQKSSFQPPLHTVPSPVGLELSREGDVLLDRSENGIRSFTVPSLGRARVGLVREVLARRNPLLLFLFLALFLLR